MFALARISKRIIAKLHNCMRKMLKQGDYYNCKLWREDYYNCNFSLQL